MKSSVYVHVLPCGRGNGAISDAIHAVAGDCAALYRLCFTFAPGGVSHSLCYSIQPLDARGSAVEHLRLGFAVC